MDTKQLNLGDLISLLEKINPKDENGEAVLVYFDFGYSKPRAVSSWRGDYSELAIEFDEASKEMPLTAFLEMLKSAVGKTFEGYKGGDFLMRKSTRLWVANWGNSSSTGITGIRREYNYIYLQTSHFDY